MYKRPHSERRNVLPVVLASGIATLAACAAPDGRTEQSTGAPSTSTVAIALPINAATPVHVHVTPLSVCRLTADGIPLTSDINGNLHLSMRAKSADSATVPLTCTAKDGTTAVYQLAVSGTTDAAAIAQTQADMAVLAATPSGTPIPSLVHEPDSYDNKWLFEHGYGLRPDRTTRPEHYARWRDSVTKPGVFVPLESSVEVPVSNTTLVYNGGAGKGGWSGAVDYNLTGDQQMVTANAEFKVPQVFAESNIGNISTASTWAGLGGFNNSPLWQTGIDEFTQSLLFFETATYHAFWQLWPNTHSNETFSVNNGDPVRGEVWICDIANGFAITTVSNANARLCFWVHDDANNQTSSGYWTANPAGTWPTAFNTAEAIQEWNDNGANDYAQFNAFNFSQAWDITSGMSQRTMGSSSTSMLQIGSSTHSQGGSCMATTSGTCSASGTQVRVWWNSHQ